MKVKLGQAVKMFFSNSSLEMVYLEAIANSLDADATEINIDISIKSYSQTETLEITIKDNGLGFTDDRYNKFCKLFDVDESSHKGLGRLVFPFYFEDILISSHYDGTLKREFNFDEDIDENSSIVTKTKNTLTGTTIKLSNYLLTKLGKNVFINPKYLKQRILEEFYSRLFKYKQNKKNISITITSIIENKKQQEIITSKEIPTLTKVEIDSTVNLFDKSQLYYSIEEVDAIESSFIAAVSVDNRTIKVDIVAQENIPTGYKMVFLLFSTLFIGKVDHLRQNLTLSEIEIKNVTTLFRKEVAKIIEQKIPRVAERNNETKKNLIDTFPHLSGYFDKDNIGYISRKDILKKAQNEFFYEQKNILETKTLTDEQYDKAMELSSRSLAEYVLYREKIIGKLKRITADNSEADIHNLIMPKNMVLNDNSDLSTIYKNNLWLLDDKYMTYSTAMSEKSMKDIIEEITQEPATKDLSAPDIAIIFSDNPKLEKNKTVDVVIVELKKRGIKLAKTEEVISQLKQRARKLMKFYPNKIQRIWFYGIVEFNDDFKWSLKDDGYKPLYSKDSLYYKENQISLNPDDNVFYNIGTYILSIDAFIEDAKSRNSTFLQILKDGFQKEQEDE